jgi:hypothetical protein
MRCCHPLLSTGTGRNVGSAGVAPRTRPPPDRNPPERGVRGGRPRGRHDEWPVPARFAGKGHLGHEWS